MTQDVKSRLVLVQEEKSKVALTTDMWTSEANDAYLGLRLQNNFKMHGRNKLQNLSRNKLISTTVLC